MDALNLLDLDKKNIIIFYNCFFCNLERNPIVLQKEQESTTNELIETINDFNASSNLGISKETIAQLKEILQSADMVKFAKSSPIVEEIKGHRNLSERILQSLKPVKKEEEEPIKAAENEVE